VFVFREQILSVSPRLDALNTMQVNEVFLLLFLQKKKILPFGRP